MAISHLLIQIFKNRHISLLYAIGLQLTDGAAAGSEPALTGTNAT